MNTYVGPVYKWPYRKHANGLTAKGVTARGSPPALAGKISVCR